MITVELPRLMEELFLGGEISIGIDCISVANSATSGNPSGKTQRIKRLIPQSRSEGKSVQLIHGGIASATKQASCQQG